MFDRVSNTPLRNDWKEIRFSLHFKSKYSFKSPWNLETSYNSDTIITEFEQTWIKHRIN